MSINVSWDSIVVVSQADELHSKTLNDHVGIRKELEKVELDTVKEKASLEQAELVMQNKLTKKV